MDNFEIFDVIDRLRTQTMAGREQKAREGKWNGAFAPYGYQLEKGNLLIAEDEAEIIRIIYDRYIHTSDGLVAVANYLNNHGYTKKIRQNGQFPVFPLTLKKYFYSNYTLIHGEFSTDGRVSFLKIARSCEKTFNNSGIILTSSITMYIIVLEEQKWIKKVWTMKISYKKLWIRLIEKEITPATLRKDLNIATGTMTKLRRNEEVALSVLLRICEYLDCNIGDICDVVKVEND